MGRRYVALIGATFLVVGVIVMSTAHVMNVFIGMPSCTISTTFWA